jgi:2-amino-4-hydroxy-6-hydroxymethyldihydropteridine diphosphokinase
VKYTVHLSLGSNLDKEANIRAALVLLAGLGRLTGVSPVYETQPVGMEPETPSFLNGAVRLETDLEPAILKRRLRVEVEEALGRVRDPDGAWISRPIDVDIALARTADGEFVQAPDPDIGRYLHVARPLADLDPDLLLPGADRSLREIARDLEAAQPLPARRPDIILEA